MSRDGRRDFDFLHGRWRVRNERLRERLAGCTDWERFESSVECHPVLGGIGNIETHDSDWNGGYRGLALRLYAPATRRPASRVIRPPRKFRAIDASGTVNANAAPGRSTRAT